MHLKDVPVPPDLRRNGAWFAQWLADRRFTDVEIAKRLGVTTTTIWNYKRSEGELKPNILLALEAIDKEDLERRQALRNGG